MRKDGKDQSLFAHLLVPLEVDPPRDIPDSEKILRDRKEKQLKMKELVSLDNLLALLGIERTKRERGKRKNEAQE